MTLIHGASPISMNAQTIYDDIFLDNNHYEEFSEVRLNTRTYPSEHDEHSYINNLLHFWENIKNEKITLKSNIIQQRIPWNTITDIGVDIDFSSNQTSNPHLHSDRTSRTSGYQYSDPTQISTEDQSLFHNEITSDDEPSENESSDDEYSEEIYADNDYPENYLKQKDSPYESNAKSTIASNAQTEQSLFTKKDIAPYLKLSNEKLTHMEEWIYSNLPEPTSAKIQYKNNQFIKQYEKPKYFFDKELFQIRLGESFLFGGDIELPLVPLPKFISDDDVSQCTNIISSYSTTFKLHKKSRCHNIALVSEKIDGYILKPGDLFSFNKIVGKRTKEAGFKKAGVFINKKLTKGYGGGICQVTSTLYNAVLLAGLEIIERRNHSVPVSYAPYGRDATVDYDSGIDFSFKNNTSKPIAITTEIVKNKLNIRIVGCLKLEHDISIETRKNKMIPREKEIVFDPELEPGTKKVLQYGGASGTIKTYRIFKKDGETVKEEYIDKSRYYGGSKIIAVGPPKKAG